jgi:hypothetical protein
MATPIPTIPEQPIHPVHDDADVIRTQAAMARAQADLDEDLKLLAKYDLTIHPRETEVLVTEPTFSLPSTVTGKSQEAGTLTHWKQVPPRFPGRREQLEAEIGIEEVERGLTAKELEVDLTKADYADAVERARDKVREEGEREARPLLPPYLAKLRELQPLAIKLSAIRVKVNDDTGGNKAIEIPDIPTLATLIEECFARARAAGFDV